jgi:ABC-type polysaccharide/polyol phosphate export permease
MRVSGVTRLVHRWLSVAFTTGVLVYMAAMSRGQPPAWVGLLAAVPLLSLLVTGLYLFVLPYAVRMRRGRGAAFGVGVQVRK